MTTIREQIILAALSALADVTTAKGYNTDAGNSVFRTLPRLSTRDLPSITIFPGAEESTKDYGQQVNKMPLRVEGMAEWSGVDHSSASVVSEQLLGDLIERMTAPIYTQEFNSGSEKPAVADTIIGATSSAQAYVQACSATSGSWAGGDAAGSMTLRRKNGRFQAGENLNISGGTANFATTSGSTTTETAVASVCGGLAESIAYTGGGLDEYPESGDEVTGAVVTFEVTYRTRVGNPYAQ